MNFIDLAIPGIFAGLGLAFYSFPLRIELEMSKQKKEARKSLRKFSLTKRVIQMMIAWITLLRFERHSH